MEGATKTKFLNSKMKVNNNNTSTYSIKKYMACNSELFFYAYNYKKNCKGS